MPLPWRSRADLLQRSTRGIIRPAKHILLDVAMFKWCTQERAAAVPIRCVHIQNAAMRMDKHWNIEHFSTSTGWLIQIPQLALPQQQKRDNVSVSVDTVSVESFQHKFFLFYLHLLYRETIWTRAPIVPTEGVFTVPGSTWLPMDDLYLLILCTEHYEKHKFSL